MNSKDAKAAVLDSMGFPPPATVPPVLSEARAMVVAAEREPTRARDLGEQILRRRKYGKVNLKSLERFLESLQECGIMQRAAATANLSMQSIRNARREFPMFDQLCEEANEKFIADKIDDPMRRLGITGVKEPILETQNEWDEFAGKLVRKRVIIGYRRIRYPQVTLAYARKFDARYREQQQLDVKHGGGIMVVHAPSSSVAAWMQETGSEAVRAERGARPDSDIVEGRLT